MIVFTPIYLHKLGLEAMGLVGLWTTVRAFLIRLDFGMSTTLNREFAAARSGGATWQDGWSFLKSFELISWGLAIIGAFLFAVFAPLSAYHWLNLSQEALRTAIPSLVLLGLAAAFQLPTILYQGGLIGLEKQVPMNLVIIGFSLFRDIGSVVALTIFPATTVTLFAWQALASLGQTLTQRALLTSSLPERPLRRGINYSLLRSRSSFTAGTGLISFTVMFIGLADRVVLTKIVPMALFGVYSLAQTVAGAILILVSPLSTALFPRFVSFAIKNDEAGLSKMYHTVSQVISLAVFPLSALLVFFPAAVLFAWTGKADVGEAGALTLAVLAAATGLNALLYLPLEAQLAHKWTSLTLTVNTVSVVIYVPLLIYLANNQGILGAALAILTLMVGQVIVIPYLVHRRLMRSEGLRWYLNDVAIPGIFAFVLGGLALRLFKFSDGRLKIGFELFGLWLFISGLTLICCPRAWELLVGFFRRSVSVQPVT